MNLDRMTSGYNQLRQRLNDDLYGDPPGHNERRRTVIVIWWCVIGLISGAAAVIFRLLP